jgi:hypothetical protein
VTDQAEYATDVLFRDRAALKDLYDKLLRHAALCFSAEDIMRFLGRKLHGAFAGEIVQDVKRRWPGARVKHRVKENWIKMYDKGGVMLRIETVLNDPREFKIRRQGQRHGQEVIGWFPMPKGVAYLPRAAEICVGANRRYLQALAVVDDPTPAVRRLAKVCQPVRWQGRRRRALNPLGREDAALFASVMRGEHALDGFRNSDVAACLFPGVPKDAAARRRRSAAVTRRIHLLRAHGLVAKIPRSRRYRPTRQGHYFMAAAFHLKELSMPETMHHLAA